MTIAQILPQTAVKSARKPSRIGRLLGGAVSAAFLTLSAWGAPALAQPALWAVKDADSTIYMLGTVHLLKPETQWRTEKLTAAINEASELWLELPTTDANAMAGEMMALVSKYGLSPAKPLSADLSEAELATLDTAAKLAGLTGAQLNIFRPWFAGLTISTAAMAEAGFEPGAGVDVNVEAAFRERGITPKGFETAEQQIKIFADMERDQELVFLRQALDQYENADEVLDQLVDSWAKADLEALETVFVAEMREGSAELYQALLTDRNANWATQLEKVLAGKGVSFVAVGAGHLVGGDSVQAMLEARGFKVERVQ